MKNFFKQWLMLCGLVVVFTQLIAYRHTDTITVDERLIYVVIPSYNNADWCVVNLASIFSQIYTNYHVVYVDDCSTDKTSKYVTRYIQKHHLEGKITIVRNEERLGAAGSRDHGIMLCPDDAIVFNIDGDDWLLRDTVFASINKTYADDDVWATYGQYLNWPTQTPGYGRRYTDATIASRNFRQSWIVGQPRTFYAWLYKQINKKDLCGPDGSFLMAATDCAMMYPILEMAGKRIKFITDVYYQRNVATDLNVFKTLHKRQQQDNLLFLQKQPKYGLIDHLPFNPLQNIKKVEYEVHDGKTCKKTWVSSVVNK